MIVIILTSIPVSGKMCYDQYKITNIFQVISYFIAKFFAKFIAKFIVEFIAKFIVNFISKFIVKFIA